jgi:pSer/pThr/pTyr-binding forkhead associated (FHA) protein
LSGPVEGRQFAIEKERFHIGAGQENDLIISEDDFVSGQHAYIQWQAGNIFIYDMGSLNQTFVNQTQVTDAGFLLNPGDHISIGTSTLEVAPVSA